MFVKGFSFTGGMLVSDAAPLDLTASMTTAAKETEQQQRPQQQGQLLFPRGRTLFVKGFIFRRGMYGSDAAPLDMTTSKTIAATATTN